MSPNYASYGGFRSLEREWLRSLERECFGSLERSGLEASKDSDLDHFWGVKMGENLEIMLRGVKTISDQRIVR